MPRPHAGRQRRGGLALALIATIVPRAAAFGAGAGDDRIGTLAASCAACHGTYGAAVRGYANPPLSGLPAAYFLSQMRAFRDGSRPATVMNQIALGFTAAQIEALAEYFARLAPLS